MAPLLIPSTYEVEWSMGVVAPTFACCRWCSNYYTLWRWATKTHQSLQRCLQGLRSSYQRLGQDVTSPPDIKIFDQQLEVVHDLIDLRSSIRQTVSHSIVSWTREWAIQHALYSFQGYSGHLLSGIQLRKMFYPALYLLRSALDYLFYCWIQCLFMSPGQFLIPRSGFRIPADEFWIPC